MERFANLQQEDDKNPFSFADMVSYNFRKACALAQEPLVQALSPPKMLNSSVDIRFANTSPDEEMLTKVHGILDSIEPCNEFLEVSGISHVPSAWWEIMMKMSFSFQCPSKGTMAGSKW